MNEESKLKCIVFNMPDQLIDQLGLKEMESFMHSYIVTENGSVMVPWYDFIDTNNDEHDLICALVNDVEYYDASDLMKCGLVEYRDTLKQMLRVMINFHQNRFDQEQGRVEA